MMNEAAKQEAMFEALSVFAEAAQDVVTAGLEYAIGRMFICADFCNQSAEKALQSVYIYRTGHRASYDHDLAALGTVVGAPSSLVPVFELLTPFHPEAYYAHVAIEDADDTVTGETAQSCIAGARAIIAWVRSIVVEERDQS